MWGMRGAAGHPCPLGRGAAKEGSYCRWQDKAKERGEERKSLALPMKTKGLILNPGRTVSLHQVRTSPAQECWPCQVGPTRGLSGHRLIKDA